MLVNELRQTIEKKKQDELKKIIVEMYKIIPKRIKEDYDIDKIIIECSAVKKEEPVKDIVVLAKEIDWFIECAKKQYYLAPNRIIPKSERSKWRFKVKKYIKDLKTINNPIATKLLMNLYNLLSYGCRYYIFSTDDPFNSAGIVQTELLDLVMSGILKGGMTRDNIKICIDILISSEVDRNTLHSSLISVFIDNLKIIETRELAIELLKEKKIELSNRPPIKGQYLFDGKDYQTIEDINNICEAIFRLYIELYQYDDGISYYIKHYIEKDKEIMYYCLLNILEWYDLKDKWLEVYEKAMTKIDFRDNLKNKYNYVKENDKFKNRIYD